MPDHDLVFTAEDGMQLVASPDDDGASITIESPHWEHTITLDHDNVRALIEYLSQLLPVEA